MFRQSPRLCRRSSARGYVLVPVLFFVGLSAVAVGVFASAAFTNLRVSDLDLAGPVGSGIGGGIPTNGVGSGGADRVDFGNATVAGALEIIRLNPPGSGPGGQITGGRQGRGS